MKLYSILLLCQPTNSHMIHSCTWLTVSHSYDSFLFCSFSFVVLFWFSYISFALTRSIWIRWKFFFPGIKTNSIPNTIYKNESKKNIFVLCLWVEEKQKNEIKFIFTWNTILNAFIFCFFLLLDEIKWEKNCHFCRKSNWIAKESWVPQNKRK